MRIRGGLDEPSAEIVRVGCPNASQKRTLIAPDEPFAEIVRVGCSNVR